MTLFLYFTAERGLFTSHQSFFNFPIESSPEKHCREGRLIVYRGFLIYLVERWFLKYQFLQQNPLSFHWVSSPLWVPEKLEFTSRHSIRTLCTEIVFSPYTLNSRTQLSGYDNKLLLSYSLHSFNRKRFSDPPHGHNQPLHLPIWIQVKMFSRTLQQWNSLHLNWEANRSDYSRL